jgi:exonuclease SbcC
LQENETDSELEGSLPRFRQIQAELDDLEDNLSRLSSQEEQISEASRKLNDDIKKEENKVFDLQAGIDQLKDEKEAKDTELKSLSSGQEQEALEEEFTKLLELTGLYDEQLRLAKKVRNAYIDKKAIDSEISNGEKQLSAESLLLEELKGKHKSAQEHFAVLKKNVELEIRIKQYEDARDDLELNTPCPLCGSTHHPFKDNNYPTHVNEAESKREMQKGFLEKIAGEIEEKNGLVLDLNGHVENLKGKARNIGLNTHTDVHAFESNNSKLPSAIDIYNVDCIENLVMEKQADSVNLKTKISAIKELKKQIDELDSMINVQSLELVRKQGNVRTLQEQGKSNEQQLQTLAANRGASEEKRANLHHLAKNFLTNYGIELEEVALSSALPGLQQRSDKYIRDSDRLQQCNLQQVRLASELENAVRRVKDAMAILENQQLSILNYQNEVQQKESDRQLLFGSKDPLIERKRLNSNLEQLKRKMESLQEEVSSGQDKLKNIASKIEGWKSFLITSKDKCERLKSLLLEKIRIEGFSTLEDVSGKMLSDEEADDIHSLQQSLQADINTTTEILRATEDEYNREFEKKLTTDSSQRLSDILVESEQKISANDKEIGGKQNVLEKDAEDLEKYRSIKSQAEAQELEFTRWKKLSRLIGSADGKKFSKFAQSLTLARLAELANKHLKKFSDRYQVIMPANESLELKIIDAYQADVIRPMATLSGGESFLVSLALALGLSDLAGKNIQIRSLFIDEGFGTLDADTLDSAISVLESLQAGGKMIGIISHVEALKERISTQIEVKQLTGGHSKIIKRSFDKIYE